MSLDNLGLVPLSVTNKTLRNVTQDTSLLDVVDLTQSPINWVENSLFDFDPSNFSFDVPQASISLLVLRPTTTADFDRDGDVDSADLLKWEAAYGINDMADADGDGDSDAQDFLAWQRQYTGNLSSLASATVAVPEPSSVVLLCVAALLVPSRSQRANNFSFDPS